MSRLRAAIVEDGRDDYTGLYEIIWSLNTHYPEIALDTKVEAARKIVLDLLQNREITLFTNRWPTNHFEPVPPENEFQLAAATQAFEDPTDGPCLWYATP